jgi:hypothetical protein
MPQMLQPQGIVLTARLVPSQVTAVRWRCLLPEWEGAVRRGQQLTEGHAAAAVVIENSEQLVGRTAAEVAVVAIVVEEQEVVEVGIAQSRTLPTSAHSTVSALPPHSSAPQVHWTSHCRCPGATLRARGGAASRT